MFIGVGKKRRTMIARLQANLYSEHQRVVTCTGHCIDMKKKAVIVSGYFNPIHKGHLEYFNNAKALADELFVIVNNDHQRALKGQQRVPRRRRAYDHCIEH